MYELFFRVAKVKVNEHSANFSILNYTWKVNISTKRELGENYILGESNVYVVIAFMKM